MGVNSQKLILLVGPSGSGKTTIAKELEKEGYNIIHSYTTREPREPDEWGHTFITAGNWYEEDIYSGGDINYEKEIRVHANEMIAFFNDYDANQIYFATYEQYQDKGTSIYIVDPNGAKQVRENVRDAEVVTIFLIADKEVRCQRMYLRIFPSTNWNWRKNPELVLPRIRKDEKIFSKCKCDYVVDANRGLLEVVADIKEIIEQGDSYDYCK